MSALLPLLKESICIRPVPGWLQLPRAAWIELQPGAWGTLWPWWPLCPQQASHQLPDQPGPWHIPHFQRGLFNGSPRNNNSLCHQERRKGVKCLDGIRGKPRRDDLGAVIIHLIGAWGKLLDREMELKRLERAPGRLCGRAGFISNI